MVHVAAARDVDIQQDVLDEFGWAPEIEPTEIGVEVEQGVVTLTGTVTSYAKRQAAERAAQRVFGVRAVANQLVVRTPNGYARTDTEVASAVANALQWSALIPEERIQVTVANGMVTLRGSVDFNFQRVEAERQVLQLTGVLGLHNHITIAPPIEATPKEIEAAIKNGLRRNADIDESGISVSVHGHIVELHGTVHSETARAEAERQAWGPGVYKVSNLLIVEPVSR